MMTAYRDVNLKRKCKVFRPRKQTRKINHLALAQRRRTKQVKRKIRPTLKWRKEKTGATSISTLSSHL